MPWIINLHACVDSAITMQYDNAFVVGDIVTRYEDLFTFLLDRPTSEVNPSIKKHLSYFLDGETDEPGLRALYAQYQRSFSYGNKWVVYDAFIRLRAHMNPWRVFAHIFKEAGPTPRTLCLKAIADTYGHMDSLTYLTSAVIPDTSIARGEKAIEVFAEAIERELGTYRGFEKMPEWTA